MTGSGARRSGDDLEVLADAGRPASDGVLALLVRRWPIGLALVLAGVTAGCGWAWRTPDVHTAETRLSVGSQELSAQAVPGYAAALATLTSNYARYVRTTDAVREDLASSLGTSASALVDVTASPIPESNILRIEAEATDPDVAVRAADQIGAGLTAAVAESAAGVDAEREELGAASRALAAAEQQEQAAQVALDALVADRAPQPAVDAARQLVVDAATAVGVLTVEKEALSTAYRTALEDAGKATTLSVVRPAEVTRDDGASSLQRLGALGGIAGAAAAVLVAVQGDHRARRRRRRAVALVRARTDRVGDPADRPAQLAGRR